MGTDNKLKYHDCSNADYSNADRWAVQIIVENPRNFMKDDDWWFFKDCSKEEARQKASKIIAGDDSMHIGSILNDEGQTDLGQKYMSVTKGFLIGDTFIRFHDHIAIEGVLPNTNRIVSLKGTLEHYSELGDVVSIKTDEHKYIDLRLNRIISIKLLNY